MQDFDHCGQRNVQEEAGDRQTAQWWQLWPLAGNWGTSCVSMWHWNVIVWGAENGIYVHKRSNKNIWVIELSIIEIAGNQVDAGRVERSEGPDYVWEELSWDGADKWMRKLIALETKLQAKSELHVCNLH